MMNILWKNVYKYKVGLSLNKTKTKYIEVNGNPIFLETEEGRIEVCNGYKYLEVTIGNEWASKREITQRIYETNNGISKLILWSKISEEKWSINIPNDYSKHIFMEILKCLLDINFSIIFIIKCVFNRFYWEPGI